MNAPVIAQAAGKNQHDTTATLRRTVEL